MYLIFNTKTQSVVSKELSDKKRAKTRCDKLDNDYGGYAHILIDSVLYKRSIIKRVM